MLDLCMEQHDGWMRSDSRADSLGKIVRAQSLDIQRMEKQVKDAEQIRRQCLLFEQDNEKLRIENEKLLKENLEYKEELAREKIEKGDLQSRVDELNSLALEDMRNAAALAALQAEIERLSKANEVNKEDIEKLKGQTILANKAMFGFTSEKMDMLFRSFPNADQLSEDADPETGEVAEDDETSEDGTDSPSKDDAGIVQMEAKAMGMPIMTGTIQRIPVLVILSRIFLTRQLETEMDRMGSRKNQKDGRRDQKVRWTGR